MKHAPKPRQLRPLIWKHLPLLVGIRKWRVGGIPIYLNPSDEVVSRKCFVRQKWEPLEAQKITTACKPGSVCLDIGANIGFYACLMSERVGDDGQVFAFEPSPENFSYLTKNASGRKNLVVENLALGDTTGEAILFLSERHKGDHRLYEPCEGVERAECRVRCTTLHDYLTNKQITPSRISVVKMDTQGSEPRIMRGIGPLLLMMSEATFFVEFWPSAYEEQSDVDGNAYLAFLDATFDITDLNYVLGTYRPLKGLSDLTTLYETHLRGENHVEHSTLVLKLKGRNARTAQAFQDVPSGPTSAGAGACEA